MGAINNQLKCRTMTHKRVNKETKEIKATMAEDAEAQPSMRVLTALLLQACCDLRPLGYRTLPLPNWMPCSSWCRKRSTAGIARSSSANLRRLDIIGSALEGARISFCRLDGSTSNRQEVVDRFQNDEGMPVFSLA